MPGSPLAFGWGWMPLSAEAIGHFLSLGAVVWMVAEGTRSIAHRTGAEFRALLSVLSLVAMFGAAVLAVMLAATGTPATSVWLGSASWIWLIGLVALAAYVGCGLLRIRRLCRSAVATPQSIVTDVVSRSRQLLGVPQAVPVAVTDQMRLPVLAGARRPLLLLPASAANWSESQLELVVVHELAHVRRCDNFVMLCQRFAECLLWFHPGVWRISRWIDEEREYCCDDLVLAVTDRREEYAQLLIALQMGQHGPALPVSALRGSSISRRVRRILFPEEALMSRPVHWRAMFAAASCVLCGLMATGSPPSQPDVTQPIVIAAADPLPAAVAAPAVEPTIAPIEETVPRSSEPPLPVVPAKIVPAPFLGKTGTEPPPPGVVVIKRPYGEEQAAGMPDSPGAGDQATAWASRTQDDTSEWLTCEFESPLSVKTVVVHETFNPGALVKVTAFGPDAEEVVAWEGDDPTPRGDPRGVSVFPVRLPFPVQKIKLYIDSPAIPGWNEIDAVGVTDMSGEEHWTMKVDASSTFAEQDVAPPNVKRDWGPEQAAGEPDTLEPGDRVTAWASQNPDGTAEWLVCEFAEPAMPAEIIVHETFNPGAVNKLTALDDNGNETVLWEGLDPTPRDQPRGVSVYPVEPAAPIRKLKVYIDSNAVPGWNEIDAIGLRDLDGKTQWAASVEASSTYAQGQAVVIDSVNLAVVPEEQPVEPEADRAEQLQQSIDELKSQIEELQQLREEVEALKQARDEQADQ